MGKVVNSFPSKVRELLSGSLGNIAMGKHGLQSHPNASFRDSKDTLLSSETLSYY